MRIASSRLIPRSFPTLVAIIIVIAIFGCTTEEPARPGVGSVARQDDSRVSPNDETPKPDDSAPLGVAATSEDMIEVLRQAVESELGQAVVIDIDELRSDDQWAFVTAVSLTVDRTPIDYSRTKFADDVTDGVFDDWLCALLANDEGRWKMVALEIGATDAPFVDWPERYGVPRAIVFP
jgi:hypothetical protein